MAESLDESSWAEGQPRLRLGAKGLICDFYWRTQAQGLNNEQAVGSLAPRVSLFPILLGVTAAGATTYALTHAITVRAPAARVWPWPAQLAGAVPVRTAGWVLVLFGVVFILRAIGIFAQAGANQELLPMSETSLLIADLVLSVVWIAVGKVLLDIQLPPSFPEKYRDAVIRAASQCAVKKHFEHPPAFDIGTSVREPAAA